MSTAVLQADDLATDVTHNFAKLAYMGTCTLLVAKKKYVTKVWPLFDDCKEYTGYSQVFMSMSNKFVCEVRWGGGQTQ